MDPRGLLEELLQSGRRLAEQGKDAAEERLGVPEEGPEREAMLSGLKKGAVAAGLLGVLLGSGAGRRLGGTALKLGGLAAIGGLAYTAFRRWRDEHAPGRGPAAGPADATGDAGVGGASPVDAVGSRIDRLTGSAAETRSLAILRALIVAAKADGHIDATERVRINDQLRHLDLDAEAAAFIDREIEGDADPRAVAAGADSPEAAAEIYLASLLVIDEQNAAERTYLRDLARELGLAPELVAELEKTVTD